MKIKEIVKIVAKKTGRTVKDVDPVVRAMEQTIMEAVMDYGEEILAIGGRFYRREMKATKRKNPMTGEPFWAPAKYALCYYSTRRNRKVIPGQELDDKGHLLHAPEGVE